MKVSCKIEKLFWYEEKGEKSWPGVLGWKQKIINKDEDGSKVIVRWDQGYTGESEQDESTELLKRTQ